MINKSFMVKKYEIQNIKNSKNKTEGKTTNGENRKVG